MKLTLSDRLQCIANYVSAGSSVVDVGTDHAYIPIWLLQCGVSARAIATDIKPGPLRRAAADAEKYGVADRLRLLLCDGLAAVEPESVDTVILAGMGGETIQGILAAAPWALEKRMIIQPQTKPELLRAWLGAHGCRIADGSLAYDSGRIYLVWAVAAGRMAETVAVDPVLLEKRDPLLKPYTEELIKRLRKQIQGMEQSCRSDQALLQELRQQLAALLEIHREVVSWQA